MIMRSNELSDLLRPTTLVLRVIWVAITMSIAIYVLVLYLIPFGEVSAVDGSGVTTVLYAAAAALAVVALFYRQRAFSAERLQRIAEQPVDARSLAVDPQSRDVDPERLQRIEALAPEEQRALAVAHALRTRTIVVLALNEGVAVIGFVAALLAQSPPVILPFAVTAVALNLFVFPRPQAVAEQVLR
jgi:F0F1-type ATP synthase membrane subunit c/vacuolar-type H+-ATPase subunit K